MRWNKPNLYDIKIKKQFAFFPIEINNEVRWLEFVKIKYVYGVSKWHAVKFINSKEEEKEIIATNKERNKYPCVNCKFGYGHKISKGKTINCYNSCFKYQIYKQEWRASKNETSI